MDKRIYPHPIFAKEGWPFMAGTGVLALLATAMGWGFLSVIFWALFILVVQFFRDPAREIPQGEKLVLSVVDGQVLKVEKAKDPYTGRDAILISVFMNLFNVHSQKSPVDGTVLKKVYRPGKYFNASLDKASAENEQCGLVVRADDGNLVTFVQIAGLVTHRILNYVKEGDHLNRGDRYGFIRFGSRVDMYLPLNARPKVVIGEKVWGTTTVLAVLGEALDEPEAPLDESEDSSVTAPLRVKPPLHRPQPLQLKQKLRKLLPRRSLRSPNRRLPLPRSLSQVLLPQLNPRRRLTLQRSKASAL